MSEARGPHRPRLLIVGVDGATLSLIRPWAAEGRLPTFARLLEEGSCGELRSSIPPVTAPAWTSFMTGKNPGKHGLYHFIEPQPGTYDIRYTNARSRRAKTLWQILSESGLSVGVINVPMTYPPEPVSGYMVSGMDAPDGSTTITYPPELYREIREKLGKVSQQIRYLGYLRSDQRRDALLKSLEEMDEHYVRLTTYLMEKTPVDVLMVVFMSVDTVQHYFWHYMDAAHPRFDRARARKYGSAIFTVYRRIDEIVGRLRAMLAADASITIMSDHGFAATSGRVVALNRYLADLGLLKLRGAQGVWYHPARLLNDTVSKLDDALKATLTPGQKGALARLFPWLRRRWESASTGLSEVDWRNTKAYSYEILTFPSGIWINSKGARSQGTVTPGVEYDRLVQLITEKLYELRDPATGKQLVTRVYRKDEIYRGPYLDQAPDLTLDWWDGITFLGARSRRNAREGEVVTDLGRTAVVGGEWTGAHALHGVSMFSGQAFRRGARLEGAAITDVAPTLLYLLGVPIPEDMDGRILSEAFTEEFTRTRGAVMRTDDGREATRPVTVETYSEEESARVMEHLRSLGYVE